MSDVFLQTAMATWAARNLPARLDVAETAKLLGFAVHDMQILMAVGKLTPLGDPAPNAPKWFAAVEMIRLAGDQEMAAQGHQGVIQVLARQACAPSISAALDAPNQAPTYPVSD